MPYEECLRMNTPRFRSHKVHRFARLQLSRMGRFVLAVICALSMGVAAFAETPAVGAKAPDFTLSTPTGKAVRMSTVQRGHDLVLVVLRGFPGYQCPYCVRQVHDFIDHASEFKAKNTRILLVYPGPPGDLDQ
ncbi:MAG: redoxin domain-containing protein, partial [Acidobacteriaceae bacterium]